MKTDQIRATGFVLLLVTSLAGSVFAQTSPEALPTAIDRLIGAGTESYADLAAPIASDGEFFRRIYLDFTGSIPSISQTRAFLADQDPEKRVKVVDRLLSSPEYARQMQRVFDLMLMRRLPARHVPAADWQKYLRESFAANKPWDQLVREILESDGVDPALRPAARFYLDRDAETNVLTRDIASVFLGANLECAQCHSHPHVDEYKQRHYYGISAFLVRTSMVQVNNLQVLSENVESEVRYESVFEVRDKISPGPKSTLPRLFDGPLVEEPKFDVGFGYAVAPAQNVRAVPLYSRRSQLGQFIADPSSSRFRRNIANRLWYIMMGRGLVHPLDLDHSENPASHPELLDLLANTLAERQYDIKSILRDIALSQTYQRASSKPDRTGDLSEDSTFAQAMLRPLMPEQLAWSMMEATGMVEIHRTSLGAGLTEQAIFDRLAGVENTFVTLMGGEPGKPPKDFEARIDQALYLSNGGDLQSWLNPQSGNLTERLSKLPVEDNKAIAEELYLSTLTRLPDESEIQEITNYLAERSAERPQAIQELVWALVTSPEFRFNH